MNTFYHGDCKFVMSHDIETESVDLIYLDPPFYTGQIQKGIIKSTSREGMVYREGGEWNPGAMEASYDDTRKFWAEKGLANKAPEWMKYIAAKNKERAAFAAYLYYMKERLELCHKALKPTGSIYLHCDYNASHYLKMVMDEIFGVDNFRNEIAWKRSTGSGGKTASHKFTSNHDIIFSYTKSKNYTWNKIRYPVDDETLIARYLLETESSDIAVKDLIVGKPFNEIEIYLESLRNESADKLKYCSHYGRGEYKYLSEAGRWIDDIWTDIDSIAEGLRGTKERTGYPTQKPYALLERIILASSNEGDTILDPFCGCGTTIIAAQKLNRFWIGIDLNKEAYDVLEKRFMQLPLDSIINPAYAKHRIVSRDIEEIKQMNPHEFEAWVNEYYKATKPSPDGGVDGITKGGIPIQTKTWRIAYDVIDSLVASSRKHPLVKQPVEKVVAVSQTGFNDNARERKYRYEKEDNIEVILATPKSMLEL